MRFKTNFKYYNRKSKAYYIWKKYFKILNGNILDIGADQCYLKEHLSNNANYIGIGLNSDKIDLKIDLEKQPMPYEDNSFDVVLCCDMLEYGTVMFLWGITLISKILKLDIGLKEPIT